MMADRAAGMLKIHQPPKAEGEPTGVCTELWAPLAVLLAALAWFRFSGADLAVSACCYSVRLEDWPLAKAEPWRTLYEYGCVPAMVLGIGGLAVALCCLGRSQHRPMRRAGFFLALSLVLGPGLLVNLLLKPAMGRPRPVQTQPFGGDESFYRVGTPAQLANCRSFPSGHASMGFFLMAPAFMLTRRQQRLAGMIIAVGVTFGLLMGAARIVQGAHFASDVLGAAICVYLGALAAKLILRFGPVAPAGPERDRFADEFLQPDSVGGWSGAAAA